MSPEQAFENIKKMYSEYPATVAVHNVLQESLKELEKLLPNRATPDTRKEEG